MTTTKKISAGKYVDWSTYVDCGTIELTKTDRKVEFREGRRYSTRVAWQAEDGTTWVFMCGQFNELDTWTNPYDYPRMNTKTRFGCVVA